MIFGKSETEIVRLALAGHSNMTDGCALWDADNGKMVSASYTTGTVENPENHLVEVFRISQGENPIVFINDDECDGCDRYCKGRSLSKDRPKLAQIHMLVSASDTRRELSNCCSS